MIKKALCSILSTILFVSIIPQTPSYSQQMQDSHVLESLIEQTDNLANGHEFLPPEDNGGGVSPPENNDNETPLGEEWTENDEPVFISASSENTREMPERLIPETTSKTMVKAAPFTTGIAVSTSVDLASMQSGGTYVLTNNIVLYDKWTPLNLSNITLDGNGYGIYALYSVGANSGLFGEVKGTINIRNLNISSYDIYASSSYAASASVLIARAETDSVVNIEDVVCEENDWYVSGTSVAYGSLVGRSLGTVNISRCKAFYSFVGRGTRVNIDQSYVYGYCSLYGVSSSYEKYNGGLVCYASESVKITDCYADAYTINNNTSSASQSSIGGLVGYAPTVDIYRCYVISCLTGSAPNKGGLIGRCEDSTIYSSYYCIDIAELPTIGVGGVYVEQMLVETTYTGWDFASTWFFWPNGGYPQLRCFYKPVASISLDKTTADLTIGQSLSLTASVSPQNIMNSSFTWSSSAPDIVQVSNNSYWNYAAHGFAYGLKAGTATITVKSDENPAISDSCVVTVSEKSVNEVDVTLECDTSSLDYIAGSFGQLSIDKSSFSEVEITPTRLTLNNKSSSSAVNVSQLRIDAPEGFSFNKDSIEVYRYIINSSLGSAPLTISKNGSHEFTTELPKLYPIYSDNYYSSDKAYVNIHCQSSFGYSMSTFEISINKHDDDGKIVFNTDGYDYGNSAVNNGVVQTDWYLSDITADSASYNSELAIKSAALCVAAYSIDTARQSLINLGFTDFEYYNDVDYSWKVFDLDSWTTNTVGTALARKKIITQDNKVSTIIAVVLRGTNNVVGVEQWSNLKAVPKDGGYHSGFYDASNIVRSNINAYISSLSLDANNTRWLVAGHSRAAAVANIIGQYLDTTASLAKKENVYVYTFATPNVDRNITSPETYNNIFNLINNSDPVPDVPFEGWGYNKYGLMRYFTKPGLSYYTVLHKFITFSANHAHNMRTYLSWVLSRRPSEQWVGTASLTELEIACPVDVNVYKNDVLVGKIENNIVTYNNDANLVMSVEGDKKYIYFPSNEAYTYKLIGTGDGTMGVSVTTYDGTTMVTIEENKFENINLEKDKEIFTKVGGDTGAKDVKLYVIENGTIVSEINTSGQQSPLYNLTIVAGSGGAISAGVNGSYKEGDKIDIAAAPDSDYRFLKWTASNGGAFNNANNAVTTFTMPSNDTVITANFEADMTASYTIVANAGKGGTATGGGTFNENDTVTLTATPNKDYNFNGWYENGAIINGTNAVYMFQANKNRILEARFTYAGSSGNNSAGDGGGSSGNKGGTGSGSANTNVGQGDVSNVPIQLGVVMIDGVETDIKRSEDGRVTLTDADIHKKYRASMLLAFPVEDMEGGYVGVVYKNGEEIILPFSVCRDGVVAMLASEPGTYGAKKIVSSFNNKKGHWADNALEFIISRGIFASIGNNPNDPDGSMTRAMFLEVLSMLDGADLSGYNTSTFNDVSVDDPYGAAILWASDNNLVNGYGGGVFGPDNLVTREQMAVMLNNYIKYKSFNLKQDDCIPYKDEESVSQWAREAVINTKRYGLTTGVGDNNFKPKDNANRANVAQIIMNLINSVVG